MQTFDLPYSTSGCEACRINGACQRLELIGQVLEAFPSFATAVRACTYLRNQAVEYPSASLEDIQRNLRNSTAMT